MKNTSQIFAASLCGLIIALGLTGCGSEKEIDKIGNAQICLNTASGNAAVNECLAKVEGIQSASASGVRCNGAFIREGFASPQKYITALDQLKTGGTLTFMSLVTFTAAGNITTDLVNSASAYTECLNSGAKGTTLMASFGYMAMSLYDYARTNGGSGGSCSTTPSVSGYNFSSCFSSFFTLGNATEVVNMLCPTTSDASAITLQSSLGGILVATYNISCASSSANQDLCTTLGTSITNAGGTGNSRVVATKFFETLAGASLSGIPVVCP